MMVDAYHGTTSVLCTRDDLIRLVVGMQWREMVTARILADDACDADGMILDGAPSEDDPGLLLWPTASTIVDEWLGVQK